MEKIVIIGSPGAGKSTLARALGGLLNIKVFHLDRFFWEPGWKKATGYTRIDLLLKKIAIVGSSSTSKSTFPMDRFFWQPDWEKETEDTRIDVLQNLVREDSWIIEGSYLHLSELQHLDKADTIIFLDTSPLLCLYRIIKRHFEYCGRSRRDIPEGCTDRLTLLRMLKVLTFRFHGRRTIKQKLRKYKYKQIIRLSSRKEVEDFLARQGLNEAVNCVDLMVLWRQHQLGQYFFSLFSDLLGGLEDKPKRNFISTVVIGFFIIICPILGAALISHL